MPGMGGAPPYNGGLISGAFYHQLALEGLVLVMVGLVLAGVWAVVVGRGRAVVGSVETASEDEPGLVEPERGEPGRVEPAGRRVLRVGFGVLWLLDGLLQAQRAMPAGLTTNVVVPQLSGQPAWLDAMLRWGMVAWDRHPVTVAAGTVWLQIGIGVWLLTGRRGRWACLGYVVSIGWAVFVWVFGEALGGLLAPGWSWLFGAPGAVVFYALAGGLLLLPEELWRTQVMGRRLLRAMGVLLLGAGVAQAWPGRGSWHHGIATMVSSMAKVPQLGPVQASLNGFSRLAASHGFAVNLVAVVALVTIGTGLASGRRPGLWVALAGVLAAATWWLVQDFGVLGGTGTDPNSMVPQALLLVSGLLTVRHARVGSEARAPAAERAASLLDSARGSSLGWRLAGVGAAAITLVGVIPMGYAAASPSASNILALASAGTPQQVHTPAPSFTLVDQHGVPRSLASLRGKVVVLSFLDPVCSTDCPIIGAELRAADQALGAQRSRVAFVAVNLNPIYRSEAALRAFDAEMGLNKVPNWSFLTGPTPDLARVWHAYGQYVGIANSGTMILHQDYTYVIDSAGAERWVINSAPGPQAVQRSFTTLVDQYVHNTLASPA